MKRLPELRFAVALKGGVSLAVWMGGACREICELTAEPSGNGGVGGPYARLGGAQTLNLSERFSRISVDVISGTSAGGLNGVLLAQHFAYGAPFDDDIRRTWLRLGDLAGLTRRPWREASLSVLRGDHGFYPQLAETMGRLQARATTRPSEEPPNPVRLLVTATRVRESARPMFTSIGPAADASSSAAYFKFVKPVANGTTQNHHIGPDPGSRLRLAYAARCTSAFPGAFEPGRIAVSPGESAYPSMRGASSETDDPDQGVTVDLMDGGVLDNIPLAWSLRGIAASPALGRVERWLLYLDPSPTTRQPATTGQQNPGALSMTRLLARAMHVKGNVESLLDDVEAFAEVERQVAVHAAATQQALAVNPDRLDFTPGLRDTYALSNGQAETDRFRRLLRDPADLTAGDPLGVPGPFFTTRTVAHPEDGQPALLQRMPPEDERSLGMPIGDTLTDIGRGATTPLVAARALTLLLVYIRHLEQDPGQHFARTRELLYAIRDVIETAVAYRDRRLLAHATKLTRSLHDSGSGPVPTTTRDIFHRATQDTAAALAYATAPSDGPTLAATDVASWRLLRDRFVRDADQTPTRIPSDPRPYRLLWEGVIDCASTIPELGSPETIARWLAAAEVISGQARPDPLTTPAVPDFAIVSAAASSPLERLIWPGQPWPDRPLNLPRMKLSGNEIANFGGFLNARWRNADWIWGRLDAAETLINLLLRSSVEAAEERSVESLKATFLHVTEPDDPRHSLLQELWTLLDLESQWKTEPPITSGTPQQRADLARRRLAQVLIARRQVEILLEELPRRVLTTEPPQDDQDDQSTTPNSIDDLVDGMCRLGAVGEESILEVLRIPALQRTVIRLGINAFQGLTSLGRGDDQGPPADPRSMPRLEPAKWRNYLSRLAVGPFVVPMLLQGITAPLATIGAIVATWISLSLATGTWATAGHLLSLLGLTFACAAAAQRLLRVRIKTAQRAGRPYRAGPALAAVCGTVTVLGSLLWVVLLHISDTHPPPHTAGWAGVAAGLAFLLPNAAAEWQGRRSALGWKGQALRLLRLPAAATVTGLIVAGLASLPIPTHAGPIPTAWALLDSVILLYSALACNLAWLYLWTYYAAQPPKPWPPADPEA